MTINLLDEAQMTRLWTLFKDQGENVITWNHYELAEKTEEHNPEIWKAFLMSPEVSTWVDSEISIVKDSELKKMVKGAAKTRSVGQAQLINAFSKMNESSSQKEGPVFIYMHVPLNEQQEHAPNAIKLTENPFKGE